MRESVSAELLERCRRGDESAWAELVRATQREVYTLCLRILRNPDDAAEASQDAYVRAWKGLKSFRGEASFTTWLYRVASNAAISKQRSRKRSREHEVSSDDEMLASLPSGESTEGRADVRAELETLERALRALPEHYRAAVVLRDVYGMSIDEIAGQLAISESAAKVRVHRGRKKLKEMVFPANGTKS
ncbi:MAG: RNA polymerase sigma factor [Actinobacteria bacterium]|nr:RNA polymerase sigma factor [Actinomycetota bacterium]MDQ3217341.1 RNA polymerase sigma factor [Actinomycetota bacterium]